MSVITCFNCGGLKATDPRECFGGRPCNCVDEPIVFEFGPQYIDATRLWEALKRRCCVNPDRAVRCVMVEREEFDLAIKDYQTRNAKP